MMFTKVLAAAVDIGVGDAADESCFKEISVSSDSLVPGFLRMDDLPSVCGRTCVFPLKANAVVTKDCFGETEKPSDDGNYDFSVPKDWLFEGSGDLHPGDRAIVYFMPSGEYMGEYEIKGVSDEKIAVRCDLDSYFHIVSELGKSGGSLLVFSAE